MGLRFGSQARWSVVVAVLAVVCMAPAALGAGQVYWGNVSGSNPISYANLDGSGGGNLTTTGAIPEAPWGVTIDGAAGKIYWVNNDNDMGQTDGVSFANLDGSGGGNLAVTGATPNEAFGVAIDPTAGRIYWVNEGSITVAVSFANLNGSGGGNLTTTGATPSIPGWPSLLEPPSGTGAPVISGGSAASSTLSCSEGTWAPDLVESFLYRAPHSFADSWSRNGRPIIGAASSTITASSVGSYACQVTATNQAGSTTQASAAHTVSPPRPGTLRISGEKATSNGVDVTIACGGTATQSCSGNVTVTTTETLDRSTVIAVTATAKHRKRVVTVARGSYRLAGGKSIMLKLKPKGKALLKRFGKLPVIAKITQANSAGHQVTISHRKLTIKAKKHKHH
jgi:hypothetical protein